MENLCFCTIAVLSEFINNRGFLFAFFVFVLIFVFVLLC